MDPASGDGGRCAVEKGVVVRGQRPVPALAKDIHPPLIFAPGLLDEFGESLDAGVAYIPNQGEAVLALGIGARLASFGEEAVRNGGKARRLGWFELPEVAGENDVEAGEGARFPVGTTAPVVGRAHELPDPDFELRQQLRVDHTDLVNDNPAQPEGASLRPGIVSGRLIPKGDVERVMDGVTFDERGHDGLKRNNVKLDADGVATNALEEATQGPDAMRLACARPTVEHPPQRFRILGYG